jgi:hypothetical protein
VEPVPDHTIQVIACSLDLLARSECSAVLVGGCAVGVLTGRLTRPVRDIDIYCHDGPAALLILSQAGFARIAENKLRWRGTIVDIVHPGLPRIDRVNYLLLERCLASQRSVAAILTDGGVSHIPCPDRFSLLLLKLYSAARRTMWLTRSHDLHDALTLLARGS